jgi:hypothetical protein
VYDFGIPGCSPLAYNRWKAWPQVLLLNWRVFTSSRSVTRTTWNSCLILKSSMLRTSTKCSWRTNIGLNFFPLSKHTNGHSVSTKILHKICQDLLFMSKFPFICGGWYLNGVLGNKGIDFPTKTIFALFHCGNNHDGTDLVVSYSDCCIWICFFVVTQWGLHEQRTYTDILVRCEFISVLSTNFGSVLHA